MSSDGSLDIQQHMAEMQERLRQNREQLRAFPVGLASAPWPRFAGWGAVVVVVLASIALVLARSTHTAKLPKVQPTAVSSTTKTTAMSSTTKTIPWFLPATSAEAKSWLMRWWPTAPDRAGASTESSHPSLRIYFDFDSDTLRPESEPVLKTIAEILTRHPDWKMNLAGHTDNIGPDAYNLDLSNRRAEAVKTALVDDYHVDAGQVTTQGFGATRPEDSNQTRQGRAHNRRVELVQK
jgi:outer membrane protein OmpA-like peptidoglycan-associated protein